MVEGQTYLHGVVGVFVVEDEGFLNELVVSLQLVDLWLVVDDALLVLAQVLQLILQGSVHLDGDASDFLRGHEAGWDTRGSFPLPPPALETPACGCYLHLSLDPGADDVSLVGELSAQTFVVLLSCVFLDQSLVALRHQLLDLSHTIRHGCQTPSASSFQQKQTPGAIFFIISGHDHHQSLH